METCGPVGETLHVRAQGDGGEKGLACSASTGTHTLTLENGHTRAHTDTARHTEGPPGLGLIDLKLFH